MIHPCPIVQLIVLDDNYAPRDRANEAVRLVSDPAFSVVLQCSLWGECGNQVPVDQGLWPVLPGSSTPDLLTEAKPFVCEDHYGCQQCYFSFDNLWCRQPGKYELRFRLHARFNDTSERAITDDDWESVSATAGICAKSIPFEVYSYSTGYPSLLAETQLTAWLEEKMKLADESKSDGHDERHHDGDES